MKGRASDLGGRVEQFIRPEILEGSAYQVPSAAGLVKLDAMENPYPWPEGLREAWLEVLRRSDLNRYPDPDAGELKSALRSAFSIPADAALMLGNGSDEIIQIIALAVARRGALALAPEPGFAMYRLAAVAAAMAYTSVPLRADDFGLDAEAVIAAMEKHRPAVVFLAWPNNPSGNLFDRPAVEAVVRAAPGLVVIDEAYQAYAGETLLSLTREHCHVLVMRTFSKLGLAGLRLGFVTGASAWVEQFEKLRLPYNVGTLTQLTARFCLEHLQRFEEQTRRICSERDSMYRRLTGITGIRAWPSAANFLLFRSTSIPAARVFMELKGRGVLIRNLDGTHPLLAGCLRVTVGTPEENEKFLGALEYILSAVPRPKPA